MESTFTGQLARTLERRRPFAIRYFATFCLCLGLLLAAGCGPAGDPEGSQPVPAGAWFPLTVGEATLRVQLALSAQEQQRGLMHRDELGADEGMVFLFPRPGPRSFWMKNTRLPLDIGYFDPSGRLVEVRPLYPFDETAVPSTGGDIQIALETNQGWFRANGVKPGDRLDLRQLEAAVQARGGTYGSYRLDGDGP